MSASTSAGPITEYVSQHLDLSTNLTHDELLKVFEYPTEVCCEFLKGLTKDVNNVLEPSYLDEVNPIYYSTWNFYNLVWSYWFDSLGFSHTKNKRYFACIK